MPSFVTIDRSIHEFFSENPRSPKTREAVSDHSAVERSGHRRSLHQRRPWQVPQLRAQASVGFVPGAKARSAHQSRGLASLVRVTWCSDCSPHGSAGSAGRAEAVVGITCPKSAGRRCWVATAEDCILGLLWMSPGLGLPTVDKTVPWLSPTPRRGVWQVARHSQILGEFRTPPLRSILAHIPIVR